MQNKFLKLIALLTVVVFVFVSCTKKLDRFPKYDLTSEQVYKDLTGYKQVLAKLYAGLSLTGNSGPDGQGDIRGIDEGFSSYMRQYWQAQELSTDEAVMGWNDATIKDFHTMTWGSSDVFLRALYSRIYFQITLCNEFIRESAPAKLSSRGISGSDATEIGYFQAEAKFLRALSYYHALDLYGNVPFVDENDKVGSFLPVQKSKAEVFAFVEQQLKDIETKLKEPKTNEYGRADKAAAWSLLSKLYLNAEVYLGSGNKKYNESVDYAKKVIAAPYSLISNYRNLFLADNNVTGVNEIIFPITFDGGKSRTWGGTTYLVHAAIGGSMSAASHGVDFGWGGIRTTKAFVNKFNGLTGDSRMNFYTSGQNLEINDVGSFTDGYAIIKYRNVTSTGANGSNPTWVDTDFPLFRLAEIYLNYAEAVLRGATNGDAATALTYVNLLRKRAFGNSNGDIQANQLNQGFVLDERARELHWEATRRTDLIRYGIFTNAGYLWPWKGGTAAGKAVEDYRVLYPLPAADVTANTNLVQNPGY